MAKQCRIPASPACLPEACRALQWLAFGSNAFNAIVPFYPNVSHTEEYLGSTTGKVKTDNWYWTSRLIAALADASFGKSQFHIERYTFAVQSKVRQVVTQTDREVKQLLQTGVEKPAVTEEGAGVSTKWEQLLLEANRRVAEILREESEKVLKKVLDEASNVMKNQYSRSDV